MHFEAETGLYAHWKYKKFQKDKFFDRKLSWAKQLVQWQQSHPNAKEFLKSLKMDFAEKQVFVLTPKSRVVVLPEQSTPIDFAFAVHSDLGYNCKQAKVNGNIVPLNHLLEDGDIVEIITDKQNTIKRTWLGFVKSRKAKTKIKKMFGVQTQTITTEKREKKFLQENKEIIHIANCCNPLPDDATIGYRTTKRKLSIHRVDCPNIALLPKEKLTPISFSMNREEFDVGVIITAMDRPGLLNDILSKLAENQAIINSTYTKISKDNTANCEFKIKIKSTQQLEKIFSEMASIQSIYSVSRK